MLIFEDESIKAEMPSSSDPLHRGVQDFDLQPQTSLYEHGSTSIDASADIADQAVAGSADRRIAVDDK